MPAANHKHPDPTRAQALVLWTTPTEVEEGVWKMLSMREIALRLGVLDDRGRPRHSVIQWWINEAVANSEIEDRQDLAEMYRRHAVQGRKIAELREQIETIERQRDALAQLVREIAPEALDKDLTDVLDSRRSASEQG